MTDSLKIQDLNEPCLFEETGLDARISALIAPVIKPLGFRLVRVRMSGLNGLTLQIMAERADGTITIEDCDLLSRTISPVLDVEDLIERKYNLEISSPGIDRPLVRKSDFAHWAGHIAKVETNSLIDNRKKFRGTIEEVTQDGFSLKTDKAAYGEAMSVHIPFNEVNHANLILTDELIRAALKKDKQARQKLIPDDDLGKTTEKPDETSGA